MNNDTILLLKECDSGLKMAISSLDEVLDVIKNQKFKEICITSPYRTWQDPCPCGDEYRDFAKR